MYSHLVWKHFRLKRLPHIWCPGCGHGTLMRALAMAIDDLGIPREKLVLVSGIGCSSRAAGYLDYCTLHTTHGRALAFATGVKLANPDLTVIVVSGDGDASAIGGNHLIHACRRNIDITTIVFNNNIYGMTGGQYSPTTPHGDYGTTAPYGNVDKAFDICELAKGAGATFVGRSTAYHVNQMKELIKKGVNHKGFALVEGISSCPTYYGRKNKIGSAVEMMEHLRDSFVDIKLKDKLSAEKLEGKGFIGEFYCSEEPEYTASYQKIIDRFKEDNHA